MKAFKLIYFTAIDNDLPSLSEATQILVQRYPGEIEVIAAVGNMFDAKEKERLLAACGGAQVAVIHLHGGKKSCPCFDELIDYLNVHGVPVCVTGSASELTDDDRSYSTVAPETRREVARYIRYGGAENFAGLLLFLANHFGGKEFQVRPPEQPPWEGIYHPAFSHDVSLEEYLERNYDPGRLTIGLWFHRSNWVSHNTAFIDAIINEIERQRCNCLPVFMMTWKDVDAGNRGAEWITENYFARNGRRLIDVLISPLMFSLSLDVVGARAIAKENEGFLKRLNVPVIQAIVTQKSLEEWRNDIQGIGIMDISISVAMPEFDGCLISVPVASRELCEIDPYTGAKVVKQLPIPERIRKVVELARNWGRLSHIPNREKKVAIIFHNYPPRNDTIGSAHGLDSPESVYLILKEMEARGYSLENIPGTGKELMDMLLGGLTNDRRWMSPEELQAKAVDSVSRERYEGFFSAFPVEAQQRVIDGWGEPPGGLFCYDGKLLIPGMVFGNVFVGLQPPRGFYDDPSKIYHSPDVSPPHHYLAYYRWIKEVFKADAVMHIGKHGSLEWLPGKGCGLSESCFPDLAISTLPNIYPYIINDPGEGTQAKRRSYCALVDHLIPVMTNADLYEGTLAVENKLNEYYRSKSEDPAKISILRKMIWEEVVSANLHLDLRMSEEEAFCDYDRFLERLHAYLSELKDTLISDGLHVLGRPPEDDRLQSFLVALTRLKNGDVPSLRQALAEHMGYDYEDILANRGKLNPDGRVNGEILDELNDLAFALVGEYQKQGFNPAAIEEVIETCLHGRNEKIAAVLRYMSDALVPKVARTRDEIENSIGALEGRFVPPGPSGCPTRGMGDILPTGRNFYSLDPRAVPSPAAYEVGRKLGDALLEKYLAEEGRYPESIGMVVWGSPTMRTRGDDIGEVLYLMGVKPKWEPGSGHVEGIEIIPIEELGRPRIDVTLRISGFFRDAFPVVVNLIDEAVRQVAQLDEPDEVNFLAKHYREEVKGYLEEGLEELEARERASYRIFGCKPGAYGAGVSEAIFSKMWENEQDLARVYVTWGGYAYTQATYGRTVPDVFQKRLARLDATVKNEDSREYDMLSSDDFYSYHGGMIAAVKAFKGKLPQSFAGDSSDPDRVKVRTAKEETAHVFRARILNPKWIEGLKRHGYKGAHDLSMTVEIAFGWDATAEVLEDWMYEGLAQKYALDKDMQEWMREHNIYALQNITERLLEAIQRGMWQPSQEMNEALQKLYLEIEGDIEGLSGQVRG
ncbi:MAG: cobaltochelatase subunit CobN [Firmicutes bacterium]|nr:cobaltochelatase subunit CobN [Bacillota bacterium]